MSADDFTLSYEDVMQWIMNMDNTMEPEAVQDFYDWDIKDGMKLKDLYSFVRRSL